MTLDPNASDIKRDVQAALAARQELGSDYDEQFAQALTEKILTQVRQEVGKTKRSGAVLSSGQRTAIAIVSVIFLFGLPVSFHDPQLIPVLIICALAALGINFAASR